MSIQNIWFLDIETVPDVDRSHDFFTKKFKREIIEEMNADQVDYQKAAQSIWDKNAALYAEFGKIICISIGKMAGDTLYIKTITGVDEAKLLQEFKGAITKPGQEAKILCAHNGKEFDFPYLFRRMVINGIEVPEPLNVAGKKPWEVPHLDTMELWGHLQWKYRCSLDLLCHVLGVPSPKGDMDGSMVAELFYSACPSDVLPFDHEESILKRIGAYCAGDVVALVNVFCRIKNLPFVESDKIVYVNGTEKGEA